MMRRTSAVTLAALVACRFFGPSADPNAYISFPGDGGADASTDDGAPPDVDSDGGGSAGDGGATLSVDDGAPDSMDDGATAPGEGGADCGPTVPVCDPIHNTGCNPFQQCDVDPSQTSTPTGLCLFNNASGDSGTCSSSLIFETCPPKQTCVSGACRAPCFCDGDCPTGQCCSDTSGPAAFTLCRRCP